MIHRLRRATAVLFASLILAPLTGIGALALSDVTPASAAAHATGRADDGPVLVLAIGSLSWTDVDAGHTAHLASLAASAPGVGSLVVRTARPVTCPLAAWLTISAGKRATDDAQMYGQAACGRLPDVAAGTVRGWGELQALQASQAAPAPIGALGEALAGAQIPAAALGPGAALALATTSGALAGTYSDGASPAALRAALADGARLVVVDGDAPREAGPRSPAASDALINELLTAWRAAAGEDARYLLASIHDGDRGAALHLLLAGGRWGDEPSPGLLGSASTRHADLAITPDLTQTIARAVGAGSVGEGQVLARRSADGEGRLATEQSLARHAAGALPSTTAMWIVAGVVLAVALLGLGLVLRPTSSPAAFIRRAALPFALAASCLPAASYLANGTGWWLRDPQLVWLIVTTLAFALIGGWLLFRLAARHPLGAWGVVGAATAAILTVDVLSGGRLMFCAPWGLSPITGARFYGFGNTAFAFLGAGALMACTVAGRVLLRRGKAGRLAAVGLSAIVGIGVVALDGLPLIGADFGGVVPLILAFATLTFALAGPRPRPLVVVGVVVAAFVALAAIALWDRARGPERWTHLGSFADSALNGSAWGTLLGKAQANGLLLALSLPLVIAAVFGVWAYRRWWLVPGTWRALVRRFAPLGAGMAAIAVLAIAATPINDAGLTIAIAALALALPALAPALARARRDALATPAADAVAKGR